MITSLYQWQIIRKVLKKDACNNTKNYQLPRNITNERCARPWHRKQQILAGQMPDDSAT